MVSWFCSRTFLEPVWKVDWGKAHNNNNIGPHANALPVLAAQTLIEIQSSFARFRRIRCSRLGRQVIIKDGLITNNERSLCLTSRALASIP